MKRIQLERAKKAGTFKVGDERRHKKGRPLGSTNRIPTLLKDAIIAAAEQTGYDRKGKDGLTGYLRWLARYEPKSFAGLMRAVIPLHIVGKMDHEHRMLKSRDEVIDQLRERGIPIDRIYPKTIEHRAHEYQHEEHETEQ